MGVDSIHVDRTQVLIVADNTQADSSMHVDKTQVDIIIVAMMLIL